MCACLSVFCVCACSRLYFGNNGKTITVSLEKCDYAAKVIKADLRSCHVSILSLSTHSMHNKHTHVHGIAMHTPPLMPCEYPLIEYTFHALPSTMYCVASSAVLLSSTPCMHACPCAVTDSCVCVRFLTCVFAGHRPHH